MTPATLAIDVLLALPFLLLIAVVIAGAVWTCQRTKTERAFRFKHHSHIQQGGAAKVSRAFLIALAAVETMRNPTKH